MKEGDVVLTPLPQADGQIRNRPANILREMPGYGDLLVCGVGTQLHQEVADCDDPIRPGDADFAASGREAPSLVRSGFLAVLPARSLLGAIGSIEKARHARLLERLSNHLRPTAMAGETPPTAGQRERLGSMRPTEVIETDARRKRGSSPRRSTRAPVRACHGG